MKASSAGVACAAAAVVSAAGAAVYSASLGRSSPLLAAAFLATVPAGLFVALFLPLYAAVSPEPANGAKLVVFPIATSIALFVWMPLGSGDGAPPSPAHVLWVAAAANALAAISPLRAKAIRWSAGGAPFLAVVAAAVVLGALAERAASIPDPPPKIRIPGLTAAVAALAVVFAYFLAARVSASRVAQACGLALAAAGLAVAHRALHGFLPGALVVLALSLGAVYALTHVARTASAAWTFVAVALAFGAAGAVPASALGIAAAALAAALRGTQARRRDVALAGALAAVACVGASLAGALHTGRPLLGDPWPKLPFTLALVQAALALPAAIATVRLREEGSALVTLAFCSVGTVLPLLGAPREIQLPTIAALGLLSGAVFARAARPAAAAEPA